MPLSELPEKRQASFESRNLPLSQASQTEQAVSQPALFQNSKWRKINKLVYH